MRVLSLNVGSLSPTSKARRFFSWLASQDADIICLQSTVRAPDKFPAYAQLDDYEPFAHHSPSGTGQCGVAIYSRLGGKTVRRDPCMHDECQGRHVEVQLPNGILMCSTYVRSGGKSHTNVMWSQHLQCIAARMKQLSDTKCIVSGDFNLALESIDLHKPEEQYGFRPNERALFQKLITAHGWRDSFRHVHPFVTRYSRWSAKYAPAYPLGGWRIDYQFVSGPASPALSFADIYHAPTWEARFSDHAVTVADYAI